MRNRTSDLRIPRSDALTTDLQRLHSERGVPVAQRLEHRSAESEGLGFDFSPVPRQEKVILFVIQ